MRVHNEDQSAPTVRHLYATVINADGDRVQRKRNRGNATKPFLLWLYSHDKTTTSNGIHTRGSDVAIHEPN